MLNLGLEASVLLLAEFELKLDDFLLLTEVGDEGAQLSELSVGIIGSLSFAGLSRRRRCRLFDTSSVVANRLEVLMEEIVLVAEVLAPMRGRSQLSTRA